ncbi:Hypothetical protein D9617_34g040690 [Elsinoe fawcettii]|nr:Hypothetical protein D9617_34g040690 [Elsinoe fawcettii]
MRPFRSLLRRHRTLLRLSLLALFALSLDLFSIARSPSYYHPPSPSSYAPEQQQEQIFIASLSWNDAEELQDFWVMSLLDTIEALGRENVFVSVLESGSWDGAEEILMSLAEELDNRGVQRRIRREKVTHLDVVEGTIGSLLEGRQGDKRRAELAAQRKIEKVWMDWGKSEEEVKKMEEEEKEARLEQIQRQLPKKGGYVQTKKGPEVRRIPYLASLRNQVMDDMLRVEKETGKRFDKVLWLNDVKFSPSDVLSLLNTNRGDYASACAMDFRHPHEYYDTFATRTLAGNEIASQHWPFFTDPTSQAQLMSGRPIPVSACWGGMLVFDATPFYPASSSPSKRRKGTVLRSRSPEAASQEAFQDGPSSALRFRGVSDPLSQLHLEASESCLIHADNPLSERNGVFLNPRVRVAYSADVYAKIHTGRHGGARVPLSARVKGRWKLRWYAWFGKGWERALERKIRKRSRGREEEVGEWDVRGKGRMCVVDEQQVLRWNGWAHV